MKTFKLLFILLAISTFTLQNCKPDDEVGKTYGPYTLGEARDYLDFKPGSWWVYQNNKSGLYDTLVLKSISIRSQTFTGKNTIIKDMVNMLIYSTTTKYEYKYYTWGANPDAKKEVLERAYYISLIHGKSKPGDYNGETISIFFPFDSLSKAGLGVGETSYEGHDSLKEINGNTFHDIKIFKQTKDACWDGFTVNYYWAKDVGLIKKEKQKTEESWDLINYNILKN